MSFCRACRGLIKCDFLPGAARRQNRSEAAASTLALPLRGICDAATLSPPLRGGFTRVSRRELIKIHVGECRLEMHDFEGRCRAGGAHIEGTGSGQVDLLISIGSVVPAVAYSDSCTMLID